MRSSRLGRVISFSFPQARKHESEIALNESGSSILSRLSQPQKQPSPSSTSPVGSLTFSSEVQA